MRRLSCLKGHAESGGNDVCAEVQGRIGSGAAAGNLAFPFVGRAEVCVLAKKVHLLGDVRAHAGKKLIDSHLMSYPYSCLCENLFAPPLIRGLREPGLDEYSFPANLIDCRCNLAESLNEVGSTPDFRIWRPYG